MNSVNLVGRLTRDPELRRTGDSTAVCSFSLAVKRPMVKDTTDYPDCVAWRQSAEYLAQYGHKGDVVAVSGTLQSREWSDKDGNKRRAWEVVATSVELLSSKKPAEGGNQFGQNQNGYPGGGGQAQHGFQAQGFNQTRFSQQGFGGYHAPQQNDYPQLDGDDPKLPF